MGMAYKLNEAGLMTSWKIRERGVLINIMDLPELPRDISAWTTEQKNHFCNLIERAYDKELKEISWNTVEEQGKELH